MHGQLEFVDSSAIFTVNYMMTLKPRKLFKWVADKLVHHCKLGKLWDSKTTETIFSTFALCGTKLHSFQAAHDNNTATWHHFAMSCVRWRCTHSCMHCLLLCRQCIQLCMANTICPLLLHVSCTTSERLLNKQKCLKRAEMVSCPYKPGPQHSVDRYQPVLAPPHTEVQR